MKVLLDSLNKIYETSKFEEIDPDVFMKENEEMFDTIFNDIRRHFEDIDNKITVDGIINYITEKYRETILTMEEPYIKKPKYGLEFQLKNSDLKQSIEDLISKTSIDKKYYEDCLNNKYTPIVSELKRLKGHTDTHIKLISEHEESILETLYILGLVETKINEAVFDIENVLYERKHGKKEKISKVTMKWEDNKYNVENLYSIVKGLIDHIHCTNNSLYPNAIQDKVKELFAELQKLFNKELESRVKKDDLRIQIDGVAKEMLYQILQIDGVYPKEKENDISRIITQQLNDMIDNVSNVFECERKGGK